jgi:hypothetical protein
MWWGPLIGRLMNWSHQGFEIKVPISAAAMPDVAKNINLNYMFEQYGSKTDMNRNKLASDFLRDDAEWVLFLDQDTVPTEDLLPRLIALKRPFVCGVYFNRGEPHNPLLYKRVANGMYTAFTEYEKGALFPVDATGLGCALIHRSVFEGIIEQHTQFMRLRTGSRFLVHNDDIHSKRLSPKIKGGAYPQGDGMAWVEPVRPVTADESQAHLFPFFNMEYGRTEDMGFCEVATRTGFQPWIDSSLECDHIQMVAIKGNAFWKIMEEVRVTGIDKLSEEQLQRLAREVGA